ncbi:ABC transporter ATP-binding protein [Haloarcula salinisoli]|uniref:ABC transporter ATP-binding protein n=1 Tax=Haloarcula salinisoli TaxID=2487746 RepID=A0A8J7YJG1_9EURY|nr:ABC transporter ATP-binding protein [Halomicroarcula salinisoli]MBX0287138.1 ABC transporter ATP-binding protein [Halomicroarcula salinisoli]MBX0304441.1 ABC transporter ATP-binding protein [Halomicroarcula salinisoli]
MTTQDINVKQQPAVAATGSDTDTLLATDQLTKKFGGLTAVDSVDFSVTEGEIRCLIGPNGAGKSTLLELITGQLSPTEGDIYFDGTDLTGLDTHERIDTGLSVKFQSPHVYENLSVTENLRVPLQRTDRDTERVLAETLERTALSGDADTQASELSHGEKQRLEIGMALTLDPKLMLLDEPVAGMSIDETDDVAALIRSLHDDGMTFLVVEHDMEFVRRISEQVTVLNQGSILRQGPIEEIESDEEVRRIYLGENA